MTNQTLLVVSDPAAPYLKWLDKLPRGTNFAVGNRLEAFTNLADRADIILYGMHPGMKLEPVWHIAPRVQWVHSLAAGLESVLFPALAESTVPMTNSRGVFKESLGEFAIAAMLFFAKNIREMVKNQDEGVWKQFDVEMLSGKTLGVIGYGEIGRAAAVRGHALGMKIHVIRRRPQLCEQDPIVEKNHGLAERKSMLAVCDYVVCAAPLTPETRGLLGEAELQAMKPTAVIINVGRGPVVVEQALIRALSEGWIRGAALDVFDKEPLPEGHPFWSMKNVLISPHCADHTPTWTDEAMQFFLDNFNRFTRGEPLLNLVDKKSGY